MILNVTLASKTGTNYWPLPESWPVASHNVSVPIRESIPTITYVCKRVDAIHHENFPFDKYELAPSALTSQVLANVPPNKCWQLFIPPGQNASLSRSNNLSPSLHYPQFSFGYLRSSVNQQSVKLFIMPFNYPALIPLIGNSIKFPFFLSEYICILVALCRSKELSLGVLAINY